MSHEIHNALTGLLDQSGTDLDDVCLGIAVNERLANEVSLDTAVAIYNDLLGAINEEEAPENIRASLLDSYASMRPFDLAEEIRESSEALRHVYAQNIAGALMVTQEKVIETLRENITGEAEQLLAITKGDLTVTYGDAGFAPAP